MSTHHQHNLSDHLILHEDSVEGKLGFGLAEHALEGLERRSVFGDQIVGDRGDTARNRR